MKATVVHPLKICEVSRPDVEYFHKLELGWTLDDAHIFTNIPQKISTTFLAHQYAPFMQATP